MLDKLVDKFIRYFNMYIAEQLAMSFAIDIALYINSRKYDKEQFEKLGLEYHTLKYPNTSIEEYCIYSDDVKTEVNDCCMNVDLESNIHDIELYHVHNDELLYAILHYNDGLNSIKKRIDAAFKRALK